MIRRPPRSTPPTNSKAGRWSQMYQDYKDLLSAFHAHGVRYLIVGGYAVIFHAQPRFTRDIDLFIKADAANAQATYAALAEFAASAFMKRSMSLVKRGCA